MSESYSMWTAPCGVQAIPKGIPARKISDEDVARIKKEVREEIEDTLRQLDQLILYTRVRWQVDLQDLTNKATRPVQGGGGEQAASRSQVVGGAAED